MYGDQDNLDTMEIIIDESPNVLVEYMAGNATNGNDVNTPSSEIELVEKINNIYIAEGRKEVVLPPEIKWIEKIKHGCIAKESFLTTELSTCTAPCMEIVYMGRSMYTNNIANVSSFIGIYYMQTPAGATFDWVPEKDDWFTDLITRDPFD
jgi:hypothetical protein